MSSPTAARNGIYLLLVVLPVLSLWIRHGDSLDYHLRVDPAGYAIQHKLERAGLEGRAIVRTAQSPENGMKVAALDGQGRLFRSDDFGASWTPVPGPSLVSIRFDPEGRLIQTGADRQVFLDGESVGPSPEEVLRLVKEGHPYRRSFADEEWLKRALKEFAFQDAGVTSSGKLWILTCTVGASLQSYGDPFRTPAGDWLLERGIPDYYQVLLKTEDGWQFLTRNAAVEALWIDPPEDLTFNQQGRELYYRGQSVPSAFFFVGLIERAGWIEPGYRYFLLGDDGIQLGTVGRGRPRTPATIWSWGYVMNEDSNRYGDLKCAQTLTLYDQDRLKVLIPSSQGVWRGSYPEGPVFHWRALAHFIAYSWVFWLLWGVALGVAVWEKKRA